jgi:hypothetical protein
MIRLLQPPPKRLRDRSEVKSPAGERLREKVYFAAIVAVLSFLGGAGGTFLASRLDLYKWRRETDYSVKKEVFAKRMELLERTIKAINRLQILDIYVGTSKYSMVEGEAAIRSGKPAARSLEPVLDGVVKVKEAQTGTLGNTDTRCFVFRTQDETCRRKS